MGRRIDVSRVQLTKDGYLEIDGKRVQRDEWEYYREFQEHKGRPPSLIKSWWQKKSRAA